MNIPVTHVSHPRTMVERKRPLWREIIDTIMGGAPRTAADQIAEYLARHQYDLAPAVRIELERRHVCV
jgi:hypothetical protein